MLPGIWFDSNKEINNTPWNRGAPGGRDRTLAVKRRKNTRKSVFFRKKIKLPKHISSSYPKIFGETNFQPCEISGSGSKVEYGEKKRKKKIERKLVITMASYELQTPPFVAHASRLD